MAVATEAFSLLRVTELDQTWYQVRETRFR
jgi:hypothetical protein